MPTKPAESITLWSSNANHIIGDYPGDPTKVSPGGGVIAAGLIPGDPAPPTAEELNYTWNLWTKWHTWVQEGSSASLNTASIVERASDGQVNLERLIVINTAGKSGIDSTGNGGSTGVVGRSTRTGVHGLGSSAFPALLGANSANGPGVQGTSTSGYGGRFTGGGSLPGIRADGGTSGAGGEFNGTGGQPDLFLTPGDNYGVDIQCGAGALGGIRILANGQAGLSITQDDPNYEAALFFGDAAAVTGVATVYSRAFGDGDAIHGITSTSTGYGLRLTVKQAAPSRGALFCSGQDARPTSITRGQITYLALEKQWAHSEFGDFGNDPGGGWRGFLSTIGGSAIGFGEAVNVAVSGAIDAWVSSALCSASGGDAPKLAGRKVLMRISLLARSNTANTAARMSLQLLDVTAGNNPVLVLSGSNGVPLPDPGAAPAAFGWTPVSMQVAVTVPLAGDRLWRLQFAASLASVAVQRVVVAFGPGMM